MSSCLCYVPKQFHGKSQKTIKIVNSILAEYAKQGFDLTTRQLHYQLVSRGLTPNTQRDYQKLPVLVSDARLAGKIDWRQIVDRTRHVRKNPHWDSPREIVESCVPQFNTDKWATQPNYIEVWTEKDAVVASYSRSVRIWICPISHVGGSHRSPPCGKPW
jgi:hypothetical protein